MNEFVTRIVEVVVASNGFLHSAKVLNNEYDSFTVWVNGTPIADVDTPAEGFRLLSAAFLKLGNQ